MITFSGQSVIGTFTSKMTHGLLAARLWARARALQFDRHLIAKFTHSLATKIASNSSSSVLKAPSRSLTLYSKQTFHSYPTLPDPLSIHKLPPSTPQWSRKGTQHGPNVKLGPALETAQPPLLPAELVPQNEALPSNPPRSMEYIEYGMPAPSILHSRLITSSSS